MNFSPAAESRYQSLANSAALRIFPNPASDVLYLSQGADPVVFFEILDQYGRQLSSGNMETSAGELSAINLPKSLPDGLFYLRTRQMTGAVITSKLFTSKP
ncbi:MAG TPA: hypothetical protein PKL15_16010 [Saprospiraceae bacterium]|nr:hypothetical protein [Saprospiraceae bacterium]